MEITRKDKLFSVSKINFADRNPHAQGGQSRTPVPTKEKMRAGRRARDKIRVLPTAVGGTKSPSGGIGGSSVAPHLHRKSLREVRSEFSWTAAFAEGRSNGTLAHFFFGTFFFCAKKKVHDPPLQREIVRGRKYGETSPLRPASGAAYCPKT